MLLEISTTFFILNYNILRVRLNEIGIHGQVHSMSLISSRSYSVGIKSSLSHSFVNNWFPTMIFYWSLFIFFLLNLVLLNIAH